MSIILPKSMGPGMEPEKEKGITKLVSVTTCTDFLYNKHAESGRPFTKVGHALTMSYLRVTSYIPVNMTDPIHIRS